MSPSLRRRAQHPPPPQFPEPMSDDDGSLEDDGMDDEDGMGDDLAGIDVEDEDEDEEEALASPTHETDTTPIPPNFREISTLASWTVSSSKPGCSIPQLRSPSTNLFWQSDGPQPHYLNIHFFKLVRIVGLRLFLDFDADESYTPTRIIFLAGSGGNDLVEWGEMRLEQPRGWVWADFSGVGDADDDEDSSSSSSDDPSDTENAPGIAHTHTQTHAQTHANANTNTLTDSPSDHENRPIPQPGPSAPPTHNLTPSNHPLQTPSAAPPSTPRPLPRRALQSLPPNTSPLPPPIPKTKKPRIPVLRAHLVQIKILENHQNGKDTHLRGLQIFAREERGGRKRGMRVGGDAVAVNGRRSLGGGKTGGGGGAGRKEGGRGGMGLGLGRSGWDAEPSIR